MINYEELKRILQKNKNIPYAEVPRLYPNKRYCNLIYDSLGGEKGELTAITQYSYESITLKNEERISNILKEIAIEEMKHLEILGNIIVNLGEKPIYMNSKGNAWTAENLTYNDNLKEIIHSNIKSEEAAISGYKNILKYTNNITLRRIYERIILDEITHLEVFKRIVNNLNIQLKI